MALPRPLPSLAKALVVAVLVVPPTAIWLSGRFGESADREFRPLSPASRATLPRSEPPAPSATRPPPPPDVAPDPAPPVTVGAGVVTTPPTVPGAVPAPAPRGGEVVGEPRGLPDPERSEATPR